MLISSSEQFFVNYANERKEISVPCDCGSVCSYMKCCAMECTHVPAPPGGVPGWAYMLNPPCPAFVLGSWLSTANPNEE